MVFLFLIVAGVSAALLKLGTLLVMVDVLVLALKGALLVSAVALLAALWQWLRHRW